MFLHIVKSVNDYFSFSHETHRSRKADFTISQTAIHKLIWNQITWHLRKHMTTSFLALSSPVTNSTSMFSLHTTDIYDWSLLCEQKHLCTIYITCHLSRWYHRSVQTSDYCFVMQAEEHKRVFSYFNCCLCPVWMSTLQFRDSYQKCDTSRLQLGFHDHISIFFLSHQIVSALDEATCSS